jgi:hypothetical protein
VSLTRQPRGTTIKAVEEGSAFYTVYWSRLAKVDKHRINGSVPAISGIYEIYYMDRAGKLNYFAVAKTWYGGLRYAIRTKTDPELEENPGRKRILDEEDCYYRWSGVTSSPDMDDLLFFFEQIHYPGRDKQRHSGRYLRIHVCELSDDKIVTI